MVTRDKDQPLLLLQWDSVKPGSIWTGLFQLEDDDYRWWKVTGLLPEINIPGINMICIEQNSKFSHLPTSYKCDDHSEFDIGFVTDNEIDLLLQSIN